MDCHYVTECLVKPWEWQPGSLRYFDFPSSTLRRGFTSKLFSKPNTNSRRIEVLLNKCIEAPLARFRDIATKPPVTQTKLDWPTQRALHLYFLAQAQRFNKAKRGGQELDQLIQKKESDLDKLVSIMLDDVQIVSLSTAAGIISCFRSWASLCSRFLIQDASQDLPTRLQSLYHRRCAWHLFPLRPPNVRYSKRLNPFTHFPLG